MFKQPFSAPFCRCCGQLKGQKRRDNGLYATTTSDEGHCGPCWISEKWQELRFEFINPAGTDFIPNICLHLSCDLTANGDWKADLMEFDAQDQTFHLYRMIPRGRVWYYFTSGGDDRTRLIADDQMAETCKVGNVKFANFVDTPDDIEEFNTPIRALPRQQEWFEPLSRNGFSEKLWTLADSVFAPRRQQNDSKSYFDSSELFDSTFERDWAKSKLQSFVKDIKILDEIKIHLKDAWPTIREIFRYYAVEGSELEAPFSIGLHQFRQLCKVRAFECQPDDVHPFDFFLYLLRTAICTTLNSQTRKPMSYLEVICISVCFGIWETSN